ncbi:MAG TPA: FecR family protein [Candidatus Binataceae bacterium]|nr:FecR family protein [Candidatus Binataceae bacterium]
MVRVLKALESLVVPLLILGFAPHAFAQAGKAAGTISALRGKATITRGGKTIPAAFAAPLQVGDQIATAPGGSVTLSLADGTQLELSESSTVTLQRNDLNADGSRANTTIELLGGLLHSLVRFAPGNAPNYQVRTPNAVAAARGTDYDTDYIKGMERKDYKDCREFTDVAVHEGEVEVISTANGKTVRLKKDHHTTVACGYVPSPSMTGTIAGAALGVAGAAGVGVTVWGVSGGGSEPTSPSH